MDFNYDDLMKKIGIGKFHYLAILSTGLIYMETINETIGMGITTVAATCDFSMNSGEKALFMCSPFFGILISNLFWNYACDIRGPRLTLILSSFLTIALALISVFMHGFYMFLLARFLMGLAVAGAISISAEYLNAFYPRDKRSYITLVFAMFGPLGAIYAPGVGFFNLTTLWKLTIWSDFFFSPWRLQLVLNIIPGAIGVLILLWLPESPKFLMNMGRNMESYESLNMICKMNTGQSLDDFYTEKSLKLMALRAPVTSKSKITSLWEQAHGIFQKPFIAPFLSGCVLMFGLFFVGNSMAMWYPSIRGIYRTHRHNNTAVLCVITELLAEEDIRDECWIRVAHEGAFDSILLGIVCAILFIFLDVLIRIFGQKWLIYLALIMSGIGGCGLIWIHDAIGSFVCFSAFIAMPNILIIVLGKIVTNMVPEINKRVAITLCFTIGRMGAIAGTILMGLLHDKYCFELVMSFVTLLAVSFTSAVLLYRNKRKYRLSF